MRVNLFLLLVFAGLLSFTSCSDDEDPILMVEFDVPPSASVIASGTVEVITEDEVRYHIVIFGDLVTSIIVESETGVTLVDVAFPFQNFQNSGSELRAYVDAIAKPISVIITHAHQDHYGNMDKFTDVMVYAEAQSAAVLLSDPNFTGLYSGELNAVTGNQEIGGFDFVFDNISNSETTENGFMYIPSLEALFVGDLAFNRSHAYIREYTPLDEVDELSIWISGLQDMKTNQGDYTHIFMGHNGRRGDVDVVIDENIAYLSDAQALIKGTKALTAGGYATKVKDVTDELTLLYPDYKPGGLYLALPDGFFPGDPGANWF